MQQGSNAGASSAAATLTDEQILGIEPEGSVPGSAILPNGGSSAANDPQRHSERSEESLLASESAPQRDSSGSQTGRRNDDARNGSDAPEPAWLKSLDAQPEAAAEARRWRQAALDATALDTDYFSAEPGARAGLAARLHQTDPGAFRAMLADAARVLAERDTQGLAEAGTPIGVPNGAAKSLARAARRTDAAHDTAVIPSEARNPSADSSSRTERDSSGDTGPRNDGMSAAAFPAETYRAFEAATNDDVARQVRDAIDRALNTTLPDGIADGARRRIGDDIFRDLNITLSSDRGSLRQDQRAAARLAL